MVEKVEVMLSRAVDELPVSSGWAYEPKLDGFRCVLATSESGDVRLTSRRGKPLGRYFPEVVAAGWRLALQLVLDGELVVPTGDGVDFAALQRRLHTSVARAAQLAHESPATLVAFDALAEQGHDLRGRSYDERRAILETVLATRTPAIGLMPMTVDPDAARARLGEQPSAG